MRQFPKADTQLLAYLFSIIVSLTIVIYLLRGFGILSFMPGGVIWFFVLLSIATGIIYGVQKTRRY